MIYVKKRTLKDLPGASKDILGIFYPLYFVKLHNCIT